VIWPRLSPLLARHRQWLVGVPAAVLVTALLVYARFAWLSHEYATRADRAVDRGDIPEAVAWLQKAAAIELPGLGWHLEARDRLRRMARDPEGQEPGWSRMAAIALGEPVGTLAVVRAGEGPSTTGPTLRRPDPFLRLFAGACFAAFVGCVFLLIFRGFTRELTLRLPQARLWGAGTIVFFTAWAFLLRHA